MIWVENLENEQPDSKEFNKKLKVVKIEKVPEENIKRANFTELTDKKIFGPAFLYKEPDVELLKILQMGL